MLQIGDVIQQKRKENKMTKKELSSKTNLSVYSLIKYESKKRLPSVANLSRIASVLDLNFDELYELLIEEKKSRKGK